MNRLSISSGSVHFRKGVRLVFTNPTLGLSAFGHLCTRSCDVWTLVLVHYETCTTGLVSKTTTHWDKDICRIFLTERVPSIKIVHKYLGFIQNT